MHVIYISHIHDQPGGFWIEYSKLVLKVGARRVQWWRDVRGDAWRGFRGL